MLQFTGVNLKTEEKRGGNKRLWLHQFGRETKEKKLK